MEFPSDVIAKMRPLAEQICGDKDADLPSLCLQALERWANERFVVITDIKRLEESCRDEPFMYQPHVPHPDRVIQSKRRWKRLYQ